ncbi:MAG: formate--tetrahydrofolate ligase [Bacteroidetes bacterium]|nr:formate--tetrahydrofolate ligase [Bacteroidota bacterium]
MKSDIEIAHEVVLKPIQQIAEQIGISAEAIEPYGKYKAKISFEPNEARIQQSNLILVTATTPNKSGSGKTTTSVALAQGLNKIGKKAIVALREPSLGPVFGMKGGAAGGGYSQVLPMEDINLHFTGDFHAITSANNTLAALVDNYQYFNKNTTKGLRQILWRRVLDVNDRSLRYLVSGLNGSSNGIPTETGFDITPASEIMAIFCLSNSMEDLRARIENILLGYMYDNTPFYVRDLGVAGAIVALLKDAFQPNLVQTIEGGAAFIHGGPFANIAHGCNSIMATKAALQHSEYTVTESGFGSDLGGEKFLNIKCRMAGLAPKATVLVTTTQSIKLHGKVDEKLIKHPNLEGLKAGIKNVQRHIENLKAFGQTVIVALNKFGFDTEEEIAFIENWCKEQGAHFAINEGFAKGGDGAIALANKVVEIVEKFPSKPLQHTYDLADSIETKIEKIVTRVYKGKSVSFGKNAKTTLKKIKDLNLTELPVCIAKTQFSFTDNAALVGAEEDFNIHIDNIVINSGAGFIVAVAGEIMRMPGLPKEPAANIIDVVGGEIVNLS